MRSCEVAIVGAGIAGLYAAWTLQKEDVDVLVLEARDRIGGRILSVDHTGAPADDGFDLGPSWYWPRVQPELDALIAELELTTFAQQSVGDVIFERMSRETPQRYSPAFENQQSVRLAGGTYALARSLAARIGTDKIWLDTAVEAIVNAPSGVELHVRNAGDQIDNVQARYVIAALPPRLIEANIAFEPPQAATTAKRWRATPTWMAPHAKFFAVYAAPFWQTSGLSGTAQSMVGPMAEIHDATTASGKAALFGFLSIDANKRRAIGDEAIKAACLVQLERLFGPSARTPLATLLKDWASDPLTATDTDLLVTGHPAALDNAWVAEPWAKKLALAGSETSPTEPGYLAGAITAAKRAVESYLSTKTKM